MKRLLVLGPLTLLLSSLPMFSQVSSPNQLDDTEARKLIQQVQNTPASKLDARLPATRLVDWLKVRLGEHAQTSWVLRYAPSDKSRQASAFPDCVEMDATISGKPSVVMLIAVGHASRLTPYLFDLAVTTGKNTDTGRPESTELNRLSDLPSFLDNLHQISGTQQ